MSKEISFKSQAETILQLIGGAQNVASHTNCMTRLRITVKDLDIVKMDELSELEYVIRVQVVSGVVQVVIGPGKVVKVEKEFAQLLGPISQSSNNESSEVKATDEKFYKKILPFIQGAMGPIIGILIGCALITATFNIIKLFGYVPDAEATEFVPKMIYLLSQLGMYSVNYIGMFVAISAAKYLKSNPYIPLLFAIFIYLAPIAGVTMGPITLTQGMGGMVSVLLITIIVSKVYSVVEEYMPSVLTTAFTPFVTILIGFIGLFLIVYPIAALFNFVVIGAITYLLGSGPIVNVIGHVLVGGAWPLMVLTGSHAATMSVLYPFLETSGYLPFIAAAKLFPASVTGAGIASYIKYKNAKSRAINSSGAFTAFLGITEPLMYGSLIPNGKNFLMTLAGGAVGGLFVGLFGIKVGQGATGIFTVPSVIEPETMMLPYLLIFLGTIVVTFVLVTLFGNKVEDSK